MSKFHDAMERAANRMAEPGPHLAEKSIQQEQLISAIRKMEAEANESVPTTDTAGEPAQPILADELLDTMVDDFDAEWMKTSEPAELTLMDQSIHPAYERVIQKLVTFRRSPSQGVILVAGAVSGEGASTVARNTALALGRAQGEQVVLVDSNVRTPSQHQAFQVELSRGLSDVLRGGAALTSAVRPDVAPGLSLLTAGKTDQAPPQLLTMSAMQGVAMALTSLFDWVIIDGPPVTAYPESASLATASSGCSVGYSRGTDQTGSRRRGQRVLQDSGVEVLGAVLNRRKFHIPDFIYRRL